VDLEAQHLARFAFGRHLEGTATYLAIGRKPLPGGAGIDNQFEALAAMRALNGFADFHI
jgi:hypothetical protein